MRLLDLFDHYAARTIAAGLLVVVWFSALARAAHDLWSACVVYLILTGCAILFAILCARRLKSIRLSLWLPWGLLLAAVVASGLHTVDADAWRLDAWGWFFIAVAFYLFTNTIETPERAELFLTAAGFVVLPIAAICLWQQCTGHPIGYSDFVVQRGPFSFSIRYGHWEIHGTLINANVLVGFMLYWPFLFWKKIRDDKRFWILYAACLAILLMARSWSGALTLMLGHLVFARGRIKDLVKRRPQRAAALFGIVIAIVAGVVWIKFHQPMWKRYYASSDRWYYWLTAIKVWRHSPWTGVGAGGYATAFPFFRTGPIENTLFAHSFVLGWLAETGLFGAAALLIFLVAVIRLGLRDSDPASDWEDVCAATLTSVLVFGVININLDYFLNRYLLALWIAAALVTRPAMDLPIRRLPAAACAVGVFLVIPFWLNLFIASRLCRAGLYFEMHGQARQAQRLYRHAIAVDASNSDGYAGLSRLAWSAYLRGKAADDREQAIVNIWQALQRRKDFRFMNQLQTYRSGS